MLYSCVSVCVSELPSHVPPFGFTVNVDFIASHLAVSVSSDVKFTVVVVSIFVPVALYHPLNVYPVFVGIGNSPYFPSF